MSAPRTATWPAPAPGPHPTGRAPRPPRTRGPAPKNPAHTSRHPVPARTYPTGAGA